MNPPVMVSACRLDHAERHNISVDDSGLVERVHATLI